MFFRHLAISVAALLASVQPTTERKTCVVKGSGSNVTDDAPAIRKAFQECGHHGRVVFAPTRYYVNSALEVRGLEDVEIDVKGELLVRHNMPLTLGFSN